MKKDRLDAATPKDIGDGDGMYGKFGSSEELLSAYNALQSEFTKRCQLVKELQARLDAFCAQAENAAPRSSAQCGGGETATELGADAREMVSVGAEQHCAAVDDDADGARIMCKAQEAGKADDMHEAAETGDDAQSERLADALAVIAENAAECAEALSCLQPVMDECLARYKKKLLGLGTLGTPCGTAVITPARRPRTLSEAKRLADEMLKYD